MRRGAAGTAVAKNTLQDDPELNDPKRRGKLYAVLVEELGSDGVWKTRTEWFARQHDAITAATSEASRLGIVAFSKRSICDEVFISWATARQAVTMKDYTGRAL